MPQLPPLADDEIHLWHLRHSRGDGRRPLYEVLSGYCGAAPASLVLLEEAHGRPRLQGAHANLHFSWSHSDGWACVALARELPWLGVDIERLRARPRAAELAQRFFAADEAAWVGAAAADGGDPAPRFLRLWTAKEAVLKAHGRGLGLGAHRARFDVHSGSAEPAWDDDALGAPGRWRVALVGDVPGCVGALAWRDSERRPRHLGCWPQD